MTDRRPATFVPKQSDNSNSRLNSYAPGARDLLPLDVAQKNWIETKVRDVLHRWGYHRIITPTLERLETLIAGGAVDRETLIQIPDPEGGTLGLRSELTASIARAAVTRMGSLYPQRLYYMANVFRRGAAEQHGRQQEFYQAGIELLGAGGTLADGEAILLLADCLESLGVANWQLVLGEAGLSRALLALFPIEFQTQIRHCWAHLDRVTLEQLELIPTQRDLALSILDLRGKPDRVLGKLAELDLDPSSQTTIAQLKTLIELLDATSQTPLQLVLDLSLIQTFDYYTGIVFEAVTISETEHRAHILAQGGRYDKLLALYHPQGQNCPGIGFCLNIEDLQQVLQSHAAMPHQTLTADWLVVATTDTAAANALIYGHKLRSQPESGRVEMYLKDGNIEQIRQIAIDRGVTQVAWIGDDGVEIEVLGIV